MIAASARRAHEVRLTAPRRSPVQDFRCLAAERPAHLRITLTCTGVHGPPRAVGTPGLLQIPTINERAVQPLQPSFAVLGDPTMHRAVGLKL
jgi:hypothetical protein